MATQQPLASYGDQKSLKRTRVLNVKQSKLGCYTCKQRRIKCDEVRPSCLRCQRSKRVCGGYPPNPLSNDNSPTSSLVSSRRSSDRSSSPPSGHSPPDSFNLAPWSNNTQRRLAELTCTVLGSDPHHIHSPSNAAVFAYLLPQLSLTVPCVSVAAAAFGSAYESTLLRDATIDAADASPEHYVAALQLMQSELREPSHGHVPILIASMLLAAAESIQHRQKDALQHVLGAFTLFSLKDQGNGENDDDQSSSGGSPTRNTKAHIDILEDVFRSMDVQIATFVWGKKPFLKGRRLSESMLTSNKIEDLINDQPTLIHECLHFVAKVSEECYRHYHDLPFDVIYHQGQLISWLRLWLANLDQIMKPRAAKSRTCGTPAEERHLSLLKSQVLAILITISNVKTPTQLSYDRYEREFEEILKCAEIVLGQDDASKPPQSTSTLPPFSTSPGIIQPLFFLARKCRHSLYRRRAIALLRVSGIEGPFNGDLEAAVAERIVEIEEGRPFHPSIGDDEVLLTNDIPDHRRISSCWRLSENDENQHKKSIKLCRRRFPVRALEADSKDKDVDMQWEMWEEQFSVDVERAGGFQTEPTFARGKQWRALPQESFWAEPELISMSQGIGPEGTAIDASGASQAYPYLINGKKSAFGLARPPEAEGAQFKALRAGI